MSFEVPVSGYRAGSAVRRISLIVMAASVAALVCFGQVANAAPSPSTATGFASVDLAKVYSGSKAKRDADAAMQALNTSYDTAFKTMQQNVMLSTTDLTNLAALLVKPTPTADDTTQITTLEAKAAADAKSLSDLQQKPDPQQTPDDKNKIATLSAEYQNGEQVLQQVQQDYQTALQAKNEDFNDQAAVLIHAAVGKVAAKQNLAMVFSSQVAIYAAIDITDEVAAEMAK